MKKDKSEHKNERFGSSERGLERSEVELVMTLINIPMSPQFLIVLTKLKLFCSLLSVNIYVVTYV